MYRCYKLVQFICCPCPAIVRFFLCVLLTLFLPHTLFILGLCPSHPPSLICRFIFVSNVASRIFLAHWGWCSLAKVFIDPVKTWEQMSARSIQSAPPSPCNAEHTPCKRAHPPHCRTHPLNIEPLACITEHTHCNMKHAAI